MSTVPIPNYVILQEICINRKFTINNKQTNDVHCYKYLCVIQFVIVSLKYNTVGFVRTFIS